MTTEYGQVQIYTPAQASALKAATKAILAQRKYGETLTFAQALEQAKRKLGIAH